MPGFSIFHSVPLIPQPNPTSCWAASMAMIVSFRRRASVTPQQIADAVGLNLDSCYGWSFLYAAARHWGFNEIAPASFTGEGWRQLLRDYGPLWLVEVGAPSHAVVLTGGDGDTFSLNNPWPPNVGAIENKTLQQLDSDFGGALPAVGNNVQLMYAY